MALLTIYPGAMRGKLRVPPSKSMAHRALICAALAGGESVVAPLTMSEDVRATLEGLRALGAEYIMEENRARIRGIADFSDGMARIDCGESGSTLRFLLPLALAVRGGAHMLGHGRLGERPMRPYEEICRKQGIEYRSGDGAGLNLLAKGRLKPGTFRLPGDVSSQFVSGLLMALPLLPGDSVIELEGPLQSSGYVDLTLDALAEFGVRVERPCDARFVVPGGQRFLPRNYIVEGDWSQAAVFLCAGALGGEVEVEGLKPDSHQGDRAVLDMLEALGAQTEWHDGRVRAFPGPEGLHGAVLDGSQCPDIVPIVALVAARARGSTRVENVGRLRLKECDRLQATAEMICELGGHARVDGDALAIQGAEELHGGVRMNCRDDHRMAMLAAVGALNCRLSVTLEDAQCVRKSYPDFFEDISALGGVIERLGALEG